MIKILVLSVFFCCPALSCVYAQALEGVPGYADGGSSVSEESSNSLQSVHSAMAGIYGSEGEAVDVRAGEKLVVQSPDTDVKVIEPGLPQLVGVETLGNNESAIYIATVELNGKTSILPINDTVREPYLFTDTNQRVWEITPQKFGYQYQYTEVQADSLGMFGGGGTVPVLYSQSADKTSIVSVPGSTSSVAFLEKDGVRGAALLDTGKNTPLLVTDNQERTWKYDPTARTIELTGIKFIGSKEELLSAQPDAGQEYQIYRVGKSDIYYISFNKKETMLELTSIKINMDAFSVSAHDFAAYFAQASLGIEVMEFRDYLTDNGLLAEKKGQYLFNPDINIISVPRNGLGVGGDIQTSIYHELNHVFYESNFDYRNAIKAEYNSLSDREKDGVYVCLSQLYPDIFTEEYLGEDEKIIAEYASMFGANAGELLSPINAAQITPFEGIKANYQEFARYVKDGTIDADFLTEHGSRLRTIEDEQLNKLFAP